MAQSVLLAALYVLGVASALAIGPRRDAWMCGAIAFPLGLAVAVLGAMTLVFVGAPVTPAVGVIAWAALTVGAGALAWRRGGAVDVKVLAACAAGFGVVIAIGHTALDHDPPRLVAVARLAAEDDLLLDALWRRMSRLGIFPLLTRALIGDVGTALAASTIALAGVTAWRTRAPIVVTLLLAAAVGSTALIARPFLGASHVAAATYLFAFGAMWASGCVPAALLGLGALALTTPVAPLLAGPAIALAFLGFRQVRAEALVPTTVVTTALIAWWSLPVTTVPSPGLGFAAIAVFAGALAVAYLVSREIDEEVMAPIGGRQRAIGLAFTSVVIVMLASNVRALATNQRVQPERWRITRHDTFDVERATEGMRARTIELLERE